MQVKRHVQPTTNLLVSEENQFWSQQRSFNKLLSLVELNQNQTEAESEVEEKTKKPRLLSTSSGEPLGMDSLTIIWYLTTFTCLLGFFVVMACTEKSCHRSRESKPQETGSCPPTPCPSYKNFAPPSYESVMDTFNNQRIFIVPVHDNNSFINQSLSTDSSPQPATVSTRVDVEKGEVITVW